MASCSSIVPLLINSNPNTAVAAALALAALDTETAAKEMIEANAPNFIKKTLESNDNSRIKASLKLIINSSCWEIMRNGMIHEGIVEMLCEILNKDLKLLIGKSRTMVAGLTKGTAHGEVNELVLFALRNFTSTLNGAEKVLCTIKDEVYEVLLFIVQEELGKGGEKKSETTIECAINHILPNLGRSSSLINKLVKLNPSLWEVMKLGIDKCLENMDEVRASTLSSLFTFMKNTGLSICEGKDEKAGELGEMVIEGEGKSILGGIIKLIIPRNPTFRPNEVEKLKAIGIEYNTPTGEVEKPLASGELLVSSIEFLLCCAGGKAGREYLRSIGLYAVLRELDNGFVPEENAFALESLIDLMISDEEGEGVEKRTLGFIGSKDEIDDELA